MKEVQEYLQTCNSVLVPIYRKHASKCPNCGHKKYLKIYTCCGSAYVYCSCGLRGPVKDIRFSEKEHTYVMRAIREWNKVALVSKPRKKSVRRTTTRKDADSKRKTATA